MITITTIGENKAELLIKKGTPHTTMLLGIEMLIESMMDDSSLDITIDDLLEELKRIYIRDNENKIDN